MRSFFKMAAASLLALIVFSILLFFFFLAWIGSVASSSAPPVYANSVLVVDLSVNFSERESNDPLKVLQGETPVKPGLYQAVEMIRQAGKDDRIKGILLYSNSNNNSYAASEELRNVLGEFKTSGKFIISQADVMTQEAYAVANIADKIYLNPRGFLQWSGYHITYIFFKGLLDKLAIEPQIFYAGKYKSATEPYRMQEMSDENRLQTSVWMEDLYQLLLQRTSETRKMDSAELRKLAVEGTIKTAKDALAHRLVDDLKYDDEVKDVLKEKLGLEKYDKINFIGLSTYFEATGIKAAGSSKIALIVAEGDIVDGRAEPGTIGGDTYRSLLRKARLDQSIRAIVLRVNSGGGSALASEVIWREVALARAEKPVIVSFGDVAASGGYYISCAADSIFAQPSTITGSIGVFGMLPNMEGFFKEKLGVTFDAVRTSPFADAGAIYRPLREEERELLQAGVNLTYDQFKERVAAGRKLDSAFVDSIAQGRVWTGNRALEIGLVDRLGGIQDAIISASRMANLEKYRVVIYPEPTNLFQQILQGPEPVNYRDQLKAELGEESYQVVEHLRHLYRWSGVQTRWPYSLVEKRSRYSFR